MSPELRISSRHLFFLPKIFPKKILTSIYTCYILVENLFNTCQKDGMAKRRGFKFYSTVSDRGQIFIPKVLQDYFGIQKRDKVAFIFRSDGSIVFTKNEREDK